MSMEKILLYNTMVQSMQKTDKDNIKKFQDPKSKARFFIGNPQTGGYGITLNCCE